MTAQVFRFQYETATDAPGEAETLDPVTIEADSREAANGLMFQHIARNGGRTVRCDACVDVPLLEGEEVCPDCVSFAKAIELTPAMKYALSAMVENGGEARFEFDRECDGADDCVFNDLATSCGVRGYEITSLGRAAIAAVSS